jgi:signal transduction histidine kinase
VILTVLDDDGVAVRALRDGGQDYLVKDKVSMDLLVRSIRYAIERNAIERDLRNLSARVLAAQDEERRRIARDLHEVTGQSLTVLSMNLGLVMQHSGSMSREDRRLLAEAAVLASKCSDELRTTAYLLHPPMLEELGLAGAVRDYADGFARRSGIRVDLELPEQMPGISGDMQIALFRVMQECLANIHRHSGSRTASILFVVQRDGIELTVRDCGRGMPHVGPEGSHAALGVGIAGMRERLAQLGGRLDISAEPGKGTVVRALLPLRKEATQ